MTRQEEGGYHYADLMHDGQDFGLSHVPYISKDALVANVPWGGDYLFDTKNENDERESIMFNRKGVYKYDKDSNHVKVSPQEAKKYIAAANQALDKFTKATKTLELTMV